MTNNTTAKSSTRRRYSPEEKAQAVRLVQQLREELGTTQGTVGRIARQLGYGTESVRQWVLCRHRHNPEVGVMGQAGRGRRRGDARDHNRGCRADQGSGAGEPGAATGQRDPEVGVGFLGGGARPPTAMMVDYVDANRDEFGVEPICDVLQFASSTYYAAKSRVPSARSLRDAVLLPIVHTVWMANYEVYGVRKMWKARGRVGHTVGRDQVGRLMAELGIRGVQKRLTRRTTVPDASADRHPDLVDRQFTADRPNRLWVTDLTLVPTWSGVVYVCFIIDAYLRMIVGWRATTHIRTTMVLGALEMARHARGARLQGLVCHSDALDQLLSSPPQAGVATTP